MSTDYKLVCDKHKKRVGAIVRQAGSVIRRSCYTEKPLLMFLFRHRDCPLRVVSEHKEKYGSGSYETSKEEREENWEND